MDDNAPAPEPSAASLLIVAAILTPVGISMLLYGLNLVTLDALRPNPHVPRQIFTLISLFTLACAVLAILGAAKAPTAVVNGLGWSTIGLSLVIMTAIAFDPSGSGSCSIGHIPIVGALGQSACRFTFQAFAVLIDLAALAIAANWNLKALRR